MRRAEFGPSSFPLDRISGSGHAEYLGLTRLGAALLGFGLQLSYLGGLPAMYALNLFWFGKIVAGVRKTLKGKAE